MKRPMTRQSRRRRRCSTAPTATRWSADVYGEQRAAGAAAARRRADPPRLAQDRRSDRAARPRPPTRSISAATAIPNGSASGAYAFTDFAADAPAVADDIDQRAAASGRSSIGASLGGIAALLAEGEAASASTGRMFSALVLVDITPRVDLDGVAKVQGFMRAHAARGLRVDRGGRRRGRRISAASSAAALARRVEEEPAAASRTAAGAGTGTRGSLRASARVGPAGEVERRAGRGGAGRSRFRPCWCAAAPPNWCRRRMPRVPRAGSARRHTSTSAGARHMVAGDRNDSFADAMQSFLTDLPDRS